MLAGTPKTRWCVRTASRLLVQVDAGRRCRGLAPDRVQRAEPTGELVNNQISRGETNIAEVKPLLMPNTLKANKTKRLTLKLKFVAAEFVGLFRALRMVPRMPPGGHRHRSGAGVGCIQSEGKTVVSARFGLVPR